MTSPGVLQIPSMRERCSEAEWKARIDLAACYRLIEFYGLADMMANHISSHVPGEPGAFLINPYGMMYEEITASSLIKVDPDGNILSKPDFGELDYGINKAGYVIHSAVHGARPEVACVIHTHSWASMAVSSLACGLLPLTQTAMRFLKIGYHDYQGVVLNKEEQASLLTDLGDGEAVIFRNHGALVVGRSVGEAFNWMHRLELACRAQIGAMACNTPLQSVPQHILEETWNNYQPGTRRPYGLMEWPALLRKLDRMDPSFRTEPAAGAHCCAKWRQTHEKRHLQSAVAALVAITLTMPAFAQKFPQKTVTLVVPFAPGGNLDVVARTLAPSLAQALGQPVVIDNRAGAGGAIGVSYVARAQPDAHTVLVSTPNALVVLPLLTKTTYALDNFMPIGGVATTPLVIVVPVKSPYSNVEAILSAARAQPDKLTAGHAGPGTTNHVALLQLEQASKLRLNAVPYKGSAPALSDLIGGQIDLVVDQLTSSAGHIQSGALRAVAVMSRERDPTLPNVPTLREAGLANFEATTATGLLAPAGTPKDVIDTLNAALRKALADDAIKRRLIALGSPGQATSPAEWQATLRREETSAKALAQAGKLKSE